MLAPITPQLQQASSWRKTRVLVLGSFGSFKEGKEQGGLSFACSSLVDSDLKDDFDFVRIDSTIRSLTDQNRFKRLPSALWRIIQSVYYCLFGKIHSVLCFSSHGTSFIEKGVIAIAAKTLRKKVIFMPRSGHLERQLSRSRLFASFARRVFAMSDVVVCQSSYWSSFFSRFCNDQQKLVVVENWLIDSRFVDPNVAVARSANPEEFVVGFFNRIEEAKGIFDFLGALRILRPYLPRLRAIVYGDGSALARVKQEYTDLNDCLEFAGWLADDQKQAVLRRLDTIAFCSHAEGFPNALLELLALKIPCIVTAVGATQDLIADGQTGLLVSARNPQLLADAIERFYHAPQLRIHCAENAYQRVASFNKIQYAVEKFKVLLK
jgi:glycosyltransferase involved in cell wall biosynthesis